MNSLKSVIEKVEAHMLASGLSDKARQELEQYRDRARLASGAVLGCALLVFIIVGAASAFYLKDPTLLKTAQAGLGISLAGALILLRGIWKDWNYVNLLLVLIEDASDSQIKDIFDVLKRKL